MTLAESVDDRALSTLPDHVSALVALPGEPGYERCTPWNVAVPVRPAAVVFATSAHHVAETVRFAAAHGLKVTVQATGHGAVPVGEDAILVQTGAMTDCVVDLQTRVARVGAGARWQHVLDAAAPHGLAPLCGSSPSVGVVGYLTGGGVGPLVRSVGRVLGLRAFLRSGDRRRGVAACDTGGASPTCSGVCVAASRRSASSPRWSSSCCPSPSSTAVLCISTAPMPPRCCVAWQEWSLSLPENINTSIALQQLPPLPGVPEPLAGRLTVAVRYTALDDFAEGAALLAPMREAATPILDTVGVLPYAAIGAVHADPVDPMPCHEGQVLLREFGSEAVDILLAAAGPGSASVQTIVEVRLLGGAMARQAEHPARSATARPPMR